MSCASCHNPQFGWTDHRPVAIGEDGIAGKRRTPTLIDVGRLPKLFWDGRATSLEEQALGPITSPIEMNQNLDELIAELKADNIYPNIFANLFADKQINTSNLAQALAAFERTIIHDKADHEPTASEIRGQQLFHSRSLRCNLCHKPPYFTDGLFWDIGLIGDDLGRGVYEPDNKFASHAFKTPTLWGLSKRGPYFHDGSAKTIEEVIEHYNKGGEVERDSVHPQIHPLEMTEQEKADLAAYLRTL